MLLFNEKCYPLQVNCEQLAKMQANLKRDKARQLNFETRKLNEEIRRKDEVNDLGDAHSRCIPLYQSGICQLNFFI